MESPNEKSKETEINEKDNTFPIKENQNEDTWINMEETSNNIDQQQIKAPDKLEESISIILESNIKNTNHETITKQNRIPK